MYFPKHNLKTLPTPIVANSLAIKEPSSGPLNGK